MSENIKLEVVEKVVCDCFKITPQILFSRKRLPFIIESRHIFYYLSRELTGLSFAKIGNYKGLGYDHSTVLTAHRKVENFMEIYPEWDMKVSAIQYKIEIYKDNELIRVRKDVNDILQNVSQCKTRMQLNKFLYKKIDL